MLIDNVRCSFDYDIIVYMSRINFSVIIFEMFIDDDTPACTFTVYVA